MKKLIISVIVLMQSIILFGQVKVFSGGNVSVGSTSTAQDKLHIFGGDIRFDAGYEMFMSDSAQIRCYDNSHRILFRRAVNKLEFREYGDIIFSSGSTTGNTTEKMVLKSSGNVGIGVSSPSEKIHIDGNVYMTGSKSFWMGNNSASGKFFRIYQHASNGNNYIDYSDANLFFRAGAGLSTKVTFDASGNVAIGASSSWAKLYIVANSGNQSSIICNNSFTADWQQGIVSQVNRAYGISYVVNYNSSDNFYVRGDGLACSATGFYTWSDLNKKTDINTIQNALDKVIQLRGVTYRYKQQVLQNSTDTSTFIASEQNPLEVGVIAQEVEQIIPEAVKTMHDGTKAVGYQNLVGLLIEAIKEQNVKIKSLEQSVAACCISPTDNNKKKNTGFGNNEEQGNETEKNMITNSKIKLYQNNPNPFSLSTEIRYILTEEVQQAAILIFDMQGSLLKTYNLVNRGAGKIEIFGGELKSGMYLYSLVVDSEEIDTKKMILTE